jgi:DNA-binding transcriptional LysR family regulator
MISLTSAGRGLALLPESIAHGLTTVAVLPLSEDDVEVVSWIIYREEEESDGVAFALEVASVIDKGSDLPSDAVRGA